jgi:signal peptidase II
MHPTVSTVPLSWKGSVSTPGRERSYKMILIRWLTFIGIFIAGTSVDLLTKQWVFNWRGLPGQQPVWWIVEPYFGIETAVNPGALFGMGAGFGLGFATLSIIAAVVVITWLARYRAIESWWLLIALGFVMGGIFGNLYDRLGMWNPPAAVPEWSSGVRDWILFRYQNYTWPNFNIADSLLVCGACMLAYHSFFMAGKQSAEEADSSES